MTKFIRSIRIKKEIGFLRSNPQLAPEPQSGRNTHPLNGNKIKRKNSLKISNPAIVKIWNQSTFAGFLKNC